MSADDVQRLVTVLLSSDAQQFDNFLAELMNPDNARRRFAEEMLRELRKHPDILTRCLLKALKESSVVALRAFSAMLLRKGFGIEMPPLWRNISDTVKRETQTTLLEVLQRETVADVLFKAADATAELARHLHYEGGWSDLVPQLIKMFGSGSTDVVVASFRMLGVLADSIDFGLFQSAGRDFVHVLDQAIDSGPPAVKNEAISTMCCIAVEETETSNRLQRLVPKVIASLLHSLDVSEDTSAETVLESLIDVAEDNPKFLKKSIKEICEANFKITYTESVSPSIRMLSHELLLSIAENRKHGLGNLLKAVPNFVQCVFEVSMIFLLDIQDVPEWHTAGDDTQDLGNGELYEVGMEALDRIAMTFDGKRVVSIAGTMLNAWISDEMWQRRHAAFICLSQIAEGCEKMMLQEVDALTDTCLRGFDDPVAKVRWATCQAIGQMCTDLGPDIQGSQHSRIIPQLMNAMKDDANPRVQAHAAAAVVNFCEDGDEDDILPYVDNLIPILVQLVHSPSKMVSESAIMSLATVAESVEEQFAPYYDAVMPLLRTTFVQAVDPDLMYLRAKALECISLVGVAVGADRFRQDAREVMQMIQQLHQAQLAPSDPLPTYMIQAGARMCRSLGKEFIPYLDIVMPYVMRHLTADPEVKVANGNEMDSESSDDEVETFHVGGRLVKLRTSAMEDKANACDVISIYAGTLKDGFLPYVERITDVVVPLLKFVFHEDVRTGSFRCLPELLDAVLTGMNNGANITPEAVQRMVQFTWNAAIDALNQETEYEVQEVALHSIAGMIDVLTPQLLSEDMVRSCFESLQKIFEDIDSRRNERIEASKENHDFEDSENILPSDSDDDETDETNVLDEAVTVLSSFMKKYGDVVMTYVVKIMPMATSLLSEGRTPVERRIAVCIIDDILEHCPQAGNNYLHEFFPFLMKEAWSENASLRQCSVYGVGIVASKYPEAFQPHLPELLQCLIQAAQNPQAKSPENERATDNVISAIGKIMKQFPDKVDPEIVEQVWLKNLPLLNDDLEARAMHELLVAMIEQQDTRILGGNNQNVVRIIEILVRILGAGKSMTTQETATRIINILHAFSQTMGTEVLNTAISEMTPKQQKVFHEFSASLNGE